VISIGLVDDQSLVLSGFSMLLGSVDDFRVAWQAADGSQIPGQEPVDVVLMDVNMPQVDGITATRELVSRDDHVRVIMLTSFGEQQYVSRAIDAGASGFLLKDTEPEVLIEAIWVVASGEAILSPQVTAQLLTSLRGGTPARDVAYEPLAPDLTERERAILEKVALGYTNDEIAESEFVSMSTVKTHIRHILANSPLGRITYELVTAMLEACSKYRNSPERLIRKPPSIT